MIVQHLRNKKNLLIKEEVPYLMFTTFKCISYHYDNLWNQLLTVIILQSLDQGKLKVLETKPPNTSSKMKTEQFRFVVDVFHLSVESVTIHVLISSNVNKWCECCLIQIFLSFPIFCPVRARPCVYASKFISIDKKFSMDTDDLLFYLTAWSIPWV